MGMTSTTSTNPQSTMGGMGAAMNANGQQRDFVCQMCGKTYLSNPALYLHMKIKHQ